MVIAPRGCALLEYAECTLPRGVSTPISMLIKDVIYFYYCTDYILDKITVIIFPDVTVRIFLDQYHELYIVK